jgi:glycosyltransferase involved in cell wall biosynthesis
MSQKLTIGYATSSLSSIDGWGRYSRSLIESVAKTQNVKVLTTSGAKNETSISIKSILPKQDFGLFHQIKAAWIMIRSFKGCDVIHSLVEPYSPAAAFASQILRIPLVFTMHGTYSVPPQKFSIKKILMIYMYKRVKIATTGSKYTEIKAREMVSFNECRFIPNGVDPLEFHILEDINRKNFIFTVGELKARKGADIVVRALGLLKDKFPDLQYYIAGAVENNDFVDKIKMIAEELKITERVIFLGRISDEELLKRYNECQAFVLAARDVQGSFEGFPMVFYEANACGAPVITTQGFGSEYAIKNGENGFVVLPDNPGVVAEAIENIIANPERREEMSLRSLKEASDHTWDKISLQLINLYQDARTA